MIDQALSDRLCALLEQFPELAPNPEALARRLAPALVGAGLLAVDTAAAPLAPGLPSASVTDPIDARILAVFHEHPSGRDPGLSPDVLANLTGLSGAPLARAVSALVQAGELVRDAWLVRLPQADDLLMQPMDRAHAERRREDTAVNLERRADGDRREIGDRRLYDRRMAP